MLSVRGKHNPDGSFDWKDAFADAGISAGMTFFTTLGGIGATGLATNPETSILAAAVSAAAQFFVVLAVKRGLKRGAE